MPSPPSDPSAATGTVILNSGRTTYELVQPLEQTWHGELLLAKRRFDKNLGDLVVLKRLPRDCREEDYRRLMEEIAITARLRHPGIAGMHDLEGTEADPYLVLEHVPGHRLDTLLRLSVQAGKPLSEALVCYVGAEAADALHYAHLLTGEQGRWLRLVHRNVSLSTLLVGEGGEVKLTDFGAVWGTFPERQPTEDDALPVNLAYASPEVTRKGMIDGRADQYSLAAVLLHLLTGRPLIEGAEAVTQEIHALRRRIEEAAALGSRDRAAVALAAELRSQLRKVMWNFVVKIRAITSRDVAEATRPLSTGLRPILRKALAPNRTERYVSCEEFGHELLAHLWRIGQQYGRRNAKNEVAALVRSVPHEKANGTQARGPADTKESSPRRPAGGGRRAAASKEARRKRESPTR
jgi:serine/threonine protein kinase